MNKLLKNLSVISLATTVISCGGSGGSTATPTPPTTTPPFTNNPPTSSDSIIIAPETAVTGESIGLVLNNNRDSLTSNIVWTQTAGPTVTILAPSSKVIGIEFSQAGDYQFSVTYKGTDSQTHTETHDISVSTGSNIHANIRMDHMVAEYGNVSLRVTDTLPGSSRSYSWEQTDGPSVTLDGTDGPVLYWSAPSVEEDVLRQFKVTITDNLGNSVTDHAYVLVENKLVTTNAFFTGNDESPARVATTFPYNPNSPYANDLTYCTYSNTISYPCTFSRLPLLAMDTKTPTVDDVMDRVVVSHQWMGDRFKQFLETADVHNDFKNLLRGTTAVVISSDIRPAFYWPVTGAIYLDADFFWMTPEERDTLNETPDYRSGFGSELNFKVLWRYVKNNDWALNYYSPNNRLSRTVEDLTYDVAWVIYHELAHANDYFPPSSWDSLSATTTPYDVIVDDDHRTDSDHLVDQYPLSSTEMVSLAQVNFRGNSANETQKSYGPEDIKGFFEPDAALGFYSYLTNREDYAMLFEELMMSYRYGVEYDVGITNSPVSPTSYNDFVLSWGNRGRINDEKLQERVRFSTSRVLPEVDLDAAMEAIPPVVELPQSVGWNTALNPNANGKSKFSSQQANDIMNKWLSRRHGHIKLPDLKR